MEGMEDDGAVSFDYNYNLGLCACVAAMNSSGSSTSGAGGASGNGSSSTLCHQLMTMSWNMNNASGPLSYDMYDYNCYDYYQFLGEGDTFHALTRQLNIYFIPVIICVGLITNTLSFCVFVCTHLRRHSSSVYLASLALADCGFLLSLLLCWFSFIKINVINIDVMCQLIVYVAYVSGFLSVYYVMAFTVERYIAICFPFQRAKFCSVRKAKWCVIGLAVSALVLYSFSLWTNGVVNIYGYYACTPVEEYFAINNVMLNVDVIITLIIPSFVIIILNICISVKICQTLRERRGLLSHCDGGGRRGRLGSALPQSSSSSVGVEMTVLGGRGGRATIVRRGRGQGQRGQGSQLKTTRMLLVVSTVFVLLNAPSHAYKIHSMVSSLRNEEQHISDTAQYCQELFQILYYMNFSINFFLYSAYAKRFRQGLAQLVNRLWHHVKVRCRRPSPPPPPHEYPWNRTHGGQSQHMVVTSSLCNSVPNQIIVLQKVSRSSSMSSH